jgi:deazaflavin-dependent oxidoreductase (nitroreductase family)
MQKGKITVSEQSRTSIPTKEALAQQVHMLRNNLMGPAAEYVMVITVVGRKSGEAYTIPLGYLRDGDSILALNIGGVSNWYKNVQVNPDVTLEIKGETIKARCELVTDPAERAKVFEHYKSERVSNFERLFGVPITASVDELITARDGCVFVRFHPL